MPGTASSASAGRRRARSFSSAVVTTPVLAESATPTSSSCAETVERFRKVLLPLTTTEAVAATYSVASSVVALPAATVTFRRRSMTNCESEKRTGHEPGGTASITYRPSVPVRPTSGARCASTSNSTSTPGQRCAGS